MEDINEELRETIPFDQLAARLGATREEVEQATELALPALLQGMNANAHRSQDEATSLLGALIKDHDGSVLDAEDVVDRVNPEDGKKIVGHVFGDRTDGVVNRLGAKTGGSSLMENLLPMLAPMVMAWLSKKLGGAVSSRRRGARHRRAGWATSWAGCSGEGVRVAAVSTICSVACSAAARRQAPDLPAGVSVTSWVGCSAAVRRVGTPPQAEACWTSSEDSRARPARAVGRNSRCPTSPISSVLASSGEHGRSRPPHRDQRH